MSWSCRNREELDLWEQEGSRTFWAAETAGSVYLVWLKLGAGEGKGKSGK